MMRPRSGSSLLPVGYSLQSSAVAAGEPEGAIGQQVGAVGNLQYQQVTPGGLQQRLQTLLQAPAWLEG